MHIFYCCRDSRLNYLCRCHDVTYLSSKISVGAAHRHSGFRISGKFSSVIFHFSRDQVRQPLMSTMTLASSAEMVTPLSCKTHGNVFHCFNSATSGDPPSPTQILKSTERKFVNIICYKALKLQKRALTISTRAQLIFLEIIIRVKQSAYLRSLHRTTFWSLSMFWNTVTLFTAC